MDRQHLQFPAAGRPLADYLGVTVEECARQILHKAYEKIEPVISDFAEKYRIERDQISLVGCGGGAGALLAKCIKKAEIVAYEDLGAEAIRRLEVEDLPVTVIIDSQGNNLYEQGRKDFLAMEK